MPELPPILIAGLTGFLSGFFLSIPVGPVNLTIINVGARRGFRHAALVGLGGVLMETIYCSLAFTGLASFLSTGYAKTVMELFSVAFLLFLGGKFLTAKAIPGRGKMRERFEERLHPSSPFMTGFVRVMGNPGVLVFWIILGAHFISLGLVRPRLESKSACILGVALGTSLWFFGLSCAVSFGHRKFSGKTLLRMEHGSGVGLLLLGLFNGGRIVWELVKARHHQP